MKQKIQKDVLQNFSYLPDESLVRLPILMALYGLSKASIYRFIKDGIIPAPIKLSERTSVWNVGDIRKNLRSKANG
ncbi:MAG: AlpA family phage regulatory protein [Pelagibacteraceae bacterium]|jgi:predicted DNA-binding transcriptional regulator AlpA|nr:AlpA family phage regulatory protein [Pelagibacteraceae bacterium]